MTIEQLKKLKESEDQVEFKSAQHNFSFAGSEHSDQKERRKCFLGYVVALYNEKGGKLVLGMTDKQPRSVVGTDFAVGKTGNLVDETYSRLGIRIETEEMYEGKLRVLVVTVQSRPVGKLMKFEGVPLMRTGDSLRNMDDAEILKILSESESDFSAKICKGLTIENLEKKAIEILKNKYASKQKNPSFATLTDHQILTDLHLMVNGKLTYAALILLGSKNSIYDFLPQSSVIIEYRKSESQIHHDAREEFQEALFTAIDSIWNYINQPLSNPDNHFQIGPYIYDIKSFNEEVVREAILNAVTHRIYNLTSSVVIRQFPKKMIITNPGGFPFGVTKENLLTIASTPRNKLIAEILEKTGLVERSSQGVDKMFLKCLSESKQVPDYSRTDDYQVELHLFTDIIDPAFAVFIDQEQKNRIDENKLGVWDLITLDKIRQGNTIDFLDSYYVDRLISSQLIKHSGTTTSTKFVLANGYYKIANIEAEVAGYKTQEILSVLNCFSQNKVLKMSDFVKIFDGKLSRPKVKYLIDKLCKDGILEKTGIGSGTKYNITNAFSTKPDINKSVIEFLKGKV